jgi:hypothetical protein
MKLDQESFEKILNERIDKIKDTLIVKSKEYSRNNDKLHNFNVGASITGKTREEVLHGFLLKHLISYFDMIEDIKQGKYPKDKYLDEKIGDIIIYFILFEASVKSRNDNLSIVDLLKGYSTTNINGHEIYKQPRNFGIL